MDPRLALLAAMLRSRGESEPKSKLNYTTYTRVTKDKRKLTIANRAGESQHVATLDNKYPCMCGENHADIRIEFPTTEPEAEARIAGATRGETSPCLYNRNAYRHVFDAGCVYTNRMHTTATLDTGSSLHKIKFNVHFTSMHQVGPYIGFVFGRHTLFCDNTLTPVHNVSLRKTRGKYVPVEFARNGSVLIVSRKITTKYRALARIDGVSLLGKISNYGACSGYNGRTMVTTNFHTTPARRVGLQLQIDVRTGALTQSPVMGGFRITNYSNYTLRVEWDSDDNLFLTKVLPDGTVDRLDLGVKRTAHSAMAYGYIRGELYGFEGKNMFKLTVPTASAA